MDFTNYFFVKYVILQKRRYKNMQIRTEKNNKESQKKRFIAYWEKFHKKEGTLKK